MERAGRGEGAAAGFPAGRCSRPVVSDELRRHRSGRGGRARKKPEKHRGPCGESGVRDRLRVRENRRPLPQLVAIWLSLNFALSALRPAERGVGPYSYLLGLTPPHSHGKPLGWQRLWRTCQREYRRNRGRTSPRRSCRTRGRAPRSDPLRPRGRDPLSSGCLPLGRMRRSR